MFAYAKHIDLESAAKAVGLVASLIAVLKAVTPQIIDRSLSNRVKTTTEKLSGMIDKLKGAEGIGLKTDLAVYRGHLEDCIEVEVQQLKLLRKTQTDRLTRRNAEPHGWQSWLLLYRPEGFTGVITHMWFYFILAEVLGVAVLAPRWRIHNFGFGRGIYTLVVLSLVSLLFRNVALREKSMGNALRLGALKQPNNDLTWPKRWFLSFRCKQAQFSQIAYYMCIFFAFSSAVALRGHWVAGSIMSMLILSLALVARANALARRALDTASQR